MGWPSAISPLIMVHVLLEFVGFCFRHAPQWPAAGWPHGVPAGASGSGLAQVFVDVGGGHQLERHPQFRRHGPAPGPCPMASWNTVTFNSPAFIAASASCVASMPATTTVSSLRAALSACIAPIAISSLLAITASTGMPAVIQLVIRFAPLTRL